MTPGRIHRGGFIDDMAPVAGKNAEGSTLADSGKSYTSLRLCRDTQAEVCRGASSKHQRELLPDFEYLLGMDT